MLMTKRIPNGPYRDGIAIHVREFCDATKMGPKTLRKALAELESKGFIVNLTPDRPLDKAIIRLTMFPFQSQAPTEDYLRYQSTPEEQRPVDRLGRQDARDVRHGQINGSALP
jgi:hypothetical protein